MEKIGKYEVLDRLGTGGFAVVFKGLDPFIKRWVAIKICHSSDDSVRRRFYREAEIAGRLDHRNITTIYDFGLHHEMPYLVEEYLPGEDLASLIKRQEPVHLEEKLQVLVQIARGLGYAHGQGVIHRDIKPANVRALDDGLVKIMDFGTAKRTGRDTRLTQAGFTMGTMAYLAPERLTGEPGTPASDLFSFGVLAYELLAFRRPFQGSDIAALIDRIVELPEARLEQHYPDCPPPLAEMVHVCLRKDPHQRYPSCEPVVAILERLTTQLAAARGAIDSNGAGVDLQVAALLERAKQRLEQGKRERAEMMLAEVLELDPGHPEAQRLLANRSDDDEHSSPDEPDAAAAPDQVREAVATIEGYLQDGRLASAAAALAFTASLLGPYPEAMELVRKLRQLLINRRLELERAAATAAENILAAAHTYNAAGRLPLPVVELLAEHLGDLERDGTRAQELISAARRAAQQVAPPQEALRRALREAEARASIQALLESGQIDRAEAALSFAQDLFGDFEQASELRRNIDELRQAETLPPLPTAEPAAEEPGNES